MIETTQEEACTFWEEILINQKKESTSTNMHIAQKSHFPGGQLS